MNLLSICCTWEILALFEAYPRKSVVFIGFYHRKSVAFVGFYPRKSVSLQCKLLNVRLL